MAAPVGTFVTNLISDQINNVVGKIRLTGAAGRGVAGSRGAAGEHIYFWKLNYAIH